MSESIRWLGESGMFAQRLLTTIKEKGLTQKYVAQQVGAKEQTISQYAKGKVLPNAEMIYQIANCLQVSADYLLGLSDVKSKDLNIRDIHQITGLTEEAILVLMSMISDEIKSIRKEHPEYSYSEARNILETRSTLEQSDALWMARLASILIDDGGTPAEYDFNGELVRGWSRPIFEILGDILLWHKRLGEWEFYDLKGKIHRKDGSLSDEDYPFCFTADQIQNVHLLELNNALIDLYRRLGMRERRS